MSPSYNHSYLAYRIAKAVDRDDKYNIHIELTLDIGGTDYISDIALYEKLRIDFLHDKIKAEEPPILIVEILSATQAVNEITDKFEIYFQAGVQSCWLVIPPTKTIILFQDIHHPVSYSTGHFTAPTISVDVSLENIFQ